MNAARPEQPAVCIQQNNANIRTVAINVDHPASSGHVGAVRLAYDACDPGSIQPQPTKAEQANHLNRKGDAIKLPRPA
ncbi:hypothetical protein GCM10011408_01910 [Dyella caseinilytica]|nr:hypothetical protein GCM10011408_01910 [Dyella caseinilytica]